MIVFMTEELSMRVTLESLIENHFPERVRAVDWLVLEYEGKSDLEMNLPRKIRSWTFGDPHFVILRDADGQDCIELKRRLESLASAARGRLTVRIVCQELESWLLGDSHAVCRAYPDCRFSNEEAKFRDPDRLNNAAQILNDITRERSKPRRAARIAPQLDPAKNRSHSFQVFYRTLQQHLG
jgi:hypothetical protein